MRLPSPFRPALPKALAVLVAAAVSLAACGDSDPPEMPVAAGIPEALAGIRAETLSELRYAFSLSIPEAASEPVTGEARIRFSRDDDLGRAVVLDFTNPEARVSEVRVDGVAVEPRFVADHVVLPPGAFDGRGEHEVVLRFTAGDDALNRNEGFLYTVFVPDRAHFSLPVFDQPDLKGRVRWSLRIPGTWTAMANGALLDSARIAATGEDDDPGVLVMEFAESEPIPTYLFAFAAGEFLVERAERDGRLLEMFHRETDPEKVVRNRQAIFDLHAAAIRWLEDYTGVDYPFGKFGFVLIPPFQFGGMEHPGAVTYRASSLMLEESATQAQMLGRASLIAHETAHMWFGDLVTMRWFDDVWTKEVFANFMAAKIVHPSFPDVNHDLRFLLSHHPSAYGVDRTRGANPIRQPLGNLNEAGSLYGAIIYQKAPIVMKQLEALVGEETFRDGLREYLATYAYGNATWPDLIRILDALHPADLAGWSRVWVEEAGRPRIEVLPELDPGGVVTRVTLRQSDERGRGLLWPQRLDVHLETSGGGLLRSVDLNGPEGEVHVEEPMLTLDWVLPNASGVEYALFVLDDRSLGGLVDGLDAIDDPVLRGAAWVTLWDAVLEGQLAPERFLEIALEVFPGESSEQLVGRILGYAETTYWRLLSAQARQDRWQARFEAALEGPLFSSGLGETDPTRATLLFRSWTDVAGSTRAVDRMRGLWAGERTIAGVPLSETDRTSLALGLALREAEGWRDILDRQEGAISNPDRLARFRFVRPSVDPDPVVRRAFFESLRDPANREREPWVLSGLGNLNHPDRAAAAVEFVLPALEMMEEIQRTGDIFFPTRWIAAVLRGHNTGEVAGIVDGFLEGRPDYPPRLAEKILQASDMVERSARIVYGEGDR